MAPLADADGGEDGDEDEGDGGDHDGGGAGEPRLRHDPPGAEEDDDAEDVDHAGGEDAVPGAEQHATVGGHQQAGQPPRGRPGALRNLRDFFYSSSIS